MRQGSMTTGLVAGLLALLAATDASAQVGIAQPAGQGGDAEVSAQPAGDAGNVGIYPAGDDYVTPGDAGGGADDMQAADYGEPPELGDINIRVPLTLQNLHADVTSWELECYVRSGAGRRNNIGQGSIEGEVDRGSFSGVVFVPVDLYSYRHEEAPQDVRNYRCLVWLRTEEVHGPMLKREAADREFRALEGSTTISHSFRATSRRVVGVKGNWQVE